MQLLDEMDDSFYIPVQFSLHKDESNVVSAVAASHPRWFDGRITRFDSSGYAFIRSVDAFSSDRVYMRFNHQNEVAYLFLNSWIN